MISLTPQEQEYIDNIVKYSWFFKKEAQILETVTGSISSVSSVIIILRSQSKLSSPYHRIMFFMSFWDAVTSAAMALTILPMPVDVIYPFEGRSYGTEGTCVAQGFTIVLGQAFTILSTCALALYYLATIRFGMTDETANRRLLPALFIIACMISIPIGITPLWLGMINPRPVDTHCMIAEYPWLCHDLEVECIGHRDGYASKLSFQGIMISIAVLVCCAFLFLTVTFLLVIMSVFRSKKEERATEQENQIEEDGDGTAFGHVSTSNIDEFDRTCRHLALKYIGAFFITWIWAVLSILLSRRASSNFRAVIDSRPFWVFLSTCRQIFHPLQGFFNAWIFIHNKISLLRNSRANQRSQSQIDGNRPMSFLSALKIVIVSPSVVPEVWYQI